MRFEFATATRIVFGAGTLARIGPLAAELGRRALVVTGRGGQLETPLIVELDAHGIASVVLSVAGEPTIEMVREGARLAQEAACDMVIGIGGGSAMDAGKAIAALMTNGGDLLDYLEVIGAGRSLTKPSAPLIAIPTTAGTGAEVTRNAVLASRERRVKVSLRSPFMLPRLALVDPELTYCLPPEITAGTGLDALTQLIEPFVSVRANPLTDALCREGLGRAARSLRRACENGYDTSAREDMALASLMGGLALANAGLGAVHGIAGVIGGMFPAPHGAVCARLLPHVMAANLEALADRRPDGAALLRYDELARILTGDEGASAREGVRWVRELSEALGIPPLAAYGMTQDDWPAIVEKSLVASSTKANPIRLTTEEMMRVLASARGREER